MPRQNLTSGNAGLHFTGEHSETGKITPCDSQLRNACLSYFYKVNVMPPSFPLYWSRACKNIVAHLRLDGSHKLSSPRVRSMLDRPQIGLKLILRILILYLNFELQSIQYIPNTELFCIVLQVGGIHSFRETWWRTHNK